eukprot:COSAG06_NODE_19223_length_848_cov_1.550067_2_plen_89_part_00
MLDLPRRGVGVLACAVVMHIRTCRHLVLRELLSECNRKLFDLRLLEQPRSIVIHTQEKILQHCPMHNLNLVAFFCGRPRSLGMHYTTM